MATTTDQAPNVDRPEGRDAGSAADDQADPAAGPFPWRTVLLGTIGAILLAASATGAGGVLIRDPVLGHGPLSWVRYGHGRGMVTVLLYVGFALTVWAWVRLGRHVLAKRVGTKPVLVAAACWMAPLLISPPLFTRDVFSYIAQGMQTLQGQDPYGIGPIILDMPIIVQNVHPVWQTTPAPYGPGFLLLAQGIVAIAGSNMILGVILMRLSIMTGLGLVLWALPGLCRHLGGRLPVTMWLAIASPLTVVHLVGGPHNDILMIGFLLAGILMMLERKHLLGIVFVTLAMTVKATAGLALPFMVWIWAKHLPYDSAIKRFLRAGFSATAIFAVVFTAVTFITFGRFNIGWLEGLEAPQIIANWMNIPTGIGELLHKIIGWPFIIAGVPFFDHSTGMVAITRAIAMGVLAVVYVRQWWLARHGGLDAVRRTALILLTAAILMPPTLPWYLTWGFTLFAAMAWQHRYLAIVVGLSVFLVVAYDPTGEEQMYNWPFMAVTAFLAWLAGRSLLTPDPLGLFRRKDPTTEPQEGPKTSHPRLVLPDKE
ncbi:alpha-1,6-mannosyltransferase [Tamaricihabitans halophyticus]|uniref:Alpha-1,6-mannosyltransferase n=1 Tax=Tamaricihabitans halophyticus TaxID=1262583 RepID=A0A4R2QNE8_9PSEU|nr:polyprenol phosphomannose-dependent alpha 1,6 mannosyltransferase MptB [Tamaricihabitans halophyticus]TCP50977.1 alpha-1,6-mannosyltransferase [Tamaricihabitans halophyticus]